MHLVAGRIPTTTLSFLSNRSQVSRFVCALHPEPKLTLLTVTSTEERPRLPASLRLTLPDELSVHQDQAQSCPRRHRKEGFRSRKIPPRTSPRAGARQLQRVSSMPPTSLSASSSPRSPSSSPCTQSYLHRSRKLQPQACRRKRSCECHSSMTELYLPTRRGSPPLPFSGLLTSNSRVSRASCCLAGTAAFTQTCIRHLSSSFVVFAGSYQSLRGPKGVGEAGHRLRASHQHLRQAVSSTVTARREHTLMYLVLQGRRRQTRRDHPEAHRAPSRGGDACSGSPSSSLSPLFSSV